MKKIFLIVVSLLCSLTIVKADELPTIEVGSYNASKGEEITIPVSIKNNVGFSFIGIKIAFDKDSLEFVSGDIIGLDKFTMKQVTENSSSQVVMYALTITDDVIMKEDTTFLKIKFKVKENAKNSDLKLNVTDYGNGDNGTLKFKGIDGKVSIINKVHVDDALDVKETVKENESTSEGKNDKSNDTYKWKSSDESIATVDENGKIKFNKSGEVVITKMDKDGKVLNEETYKVEDPKNEEFAPEKKSKMPIIIGACAIIILLVTVLLIIIKRKNNIKKNIS